LRVELRLGGAAMLLGVAALAAVFALIAMRGQMRGVAASFMGVEEIGREASALATLVKGQAIYGVLLIVGFGVLASGLFEAGERSLALVSFGLLVFAHAAFVIRGASDATITVWAGEQWAETGTIPEVYEPLQAFAENSFLWFGEMPFLLATAGFGWAVIRSGVLPVWVGYFAVGWSILWLVFPLVFKSDLPAAFVLFPISFGIGMLVTDWQP
jgi:hypothetical protein